MELSTKRTCAACGQEIDPLTDAWKTDGGRMRHVTCPTSAALRTLPAFTPEVEREAFPRASEAGQAGPLYRTIQEAAQLLRVSDKTIRRKIHTGELPAVRLRGGQTVLIEQSDLLGLLEDAREAA